MPQHLGNRLGTSSSDPRAVVQSSARDAGGLLPPSRLTPLLACLLGTAVLPAWGQSEAPAAPGSAASAASNSEAKSLDTVVITGIRASLESALNAKRQDRGIVDVVKAEDIAKFPDTNLAESLQRVPGVVIDRDAGEGRNITVRGLGADFTRVRINGIEALATTGGTDSSGGANRSRGFDFNVFASELFNSITVRKSSSADVDEGSLGATVDLQTARPFDFNKRVITASLKGRYNDLSQNSDPRVAFLYSDVTPDKRFGVLVSGAYSKRRVLEEGFSTVRWDNGASSGGWCSPIGVSPSNPTTTSTTCGPAAQGVSRLPASQSATDAYNAASSADNFHPRLPRYGRLTHDQDRLGMTASIQFKPFEKTVITGDMLYSKLKATRQEDFLEAISFSRTAGQGGKPQTSVVEAQYDANGALQYGRYNGVDIRAESRFDKLSTEFTQPSIKIDQEFTEHFRMSASAGRAESRFRNPVQTTVTLDALNVNGYALDFRGNDRLPSITYPFDPAATSGNPLTIVGVPRASSGTQASTVTNTTTSEIRIRPQGANNRNDVGHVELAWDWIPDSVTLKAGVDYKRYSFDTYEFRRVNQNDTIFAPTNGMAGLTTTLTGFGKGLNLPAGTATSWVIPDLNAIAAAYDIYCNCIKSGPAGGPGDFTLSSTTNGNARGNNRKVSETDTGGFVQADFDTRLMGIQVMGNVGVRYVKTEQEATGYLATGGGTEVVVGQSYKDWLPSLNVSANLTRNLVARFAAARVMARPQLGNLNPGGTISTTGTLSITSGNPNLKPFRAKTFDGSLEWYHGRNAFVGVGLFQKNIDTYIQSLRTNVPFNTTGLPLSLLPSNFTGEEVFQVTSPINTPGGKLRGIELNFQQPFSFLPSWGKNFGTVLNYTYVKSKITYLISPTSNSVITDDLLNMSPKSWNATLYYDDGVINARVSASRRSAFLTRVPGQNNNDVEGKNASTNVDASISYKYSDRLSFTLEGVNLTNEANDQFISRARNSPVVYNVTGREYLVGMAYKF
ncbi:TonB-dependent receptor [Roseateles sp. SL47]|uniref:TonB-dependent receptor n=1 Tax=Roseateles sp. SL47 TaxID=2995138 RepID=UPI002270F529|nr:TonB-dependent receptor [Roseateles sp. SL47]WAC71492.1 TonB-dependent receptor [Roseateles sp. SL47]